MNGEFTTTTIRIETNKLKAFKKLGSMNKRIAEWIDAELNSGSAQADRPRRQKTAASEKQLAAIFATRVAQLLQDDKRWALDIIRTAQVDWPASGLLADRMAHYAGSKQLVAGQLSKWLGKRIRWLLEENNNVVLLCDAGSSVLYVCQSIWAHLAEVSNEGGADTRTRREGKSITIVTPSLAVAQSFTEQCHGGLFGRRIAITCELLGGTIRHHYASLTGEATVNGLTEVKKRIQGRYITLLSGNYVRLEDAKPGIPIPLIRGEGQKEVKEALVAAGDEVYLLSSVGKILKVSNQEANRIMLGPRDREYKDVVFPKEKAGAVKLVTTVRDTGPDEGRGKSAPILLQHSWALSNFLKSESTSSDATEPDIANLKHFLYVYNDDVRNLSATEQIRVEFPHRFPNMKKVLADVFSVDTDKLGVPEEFWPSFEAEVPLAGVLK